jgi:acyl transferase domain-containing protein/aryl carrier-like protein
MSMRPISDDCSHPSMKNNSALQHDPIAVVGIGCRFPGRGNDPQSFWRLLENGQDAVTEVPADRWSVAAFHDADDSRPGKTYSRWGGFVEGIDRFDPEFFGIAPREAAWMDPQQRLLLEVAWEGLEDAGLTLKGIAGSRAAVFVGISSFDYSMLQTSYRDRAEIDVYTNTGGSLSIAANRISYCFDLRGPSVAVDTACSSALVAVHLACESIWRDGCPLALAGGVNALLLPDWYVGFCRMGMLSPDGRCRAFDARANGFVRSEGAGMVVLKPLSRAVADGDRLYAVIRGTAVNQDGRTAGMTLPSQEAQEAVIRQACRTAGVAPTQIQYVEAHGTGTPVGDPIEARALGRVLSAGRPESQPCLIGSVKTNIGHLEAGAGIAGLIKVALALHHRRIPGNLHFECPNPDIDFAGLGLRVPTRCEPWPARSDLALAGINAFGFGGTNAHVVLQEAPRTTAAVVQDRESTGGEARAEAGSPRPWLVPVSARSAEALRAAAASLEGLVARGPEEVTLGAIAATAALRRHHHEHRLAVVASRKSELAEALRDFAAGRPTVRTTTGRVLGDRPPRIAFVCSGQGPQWWAMGRTLLREEPVFRATIEQCDAVVRRLGSWSLLEELTAGEPDSRIEETAIAQPCLFALQVALAALWASWGVRPEALVGHSVGEVAAAHLAGVLDLDEAVRVIHQRGRCMQQAPRLGRMLAAGVTPEEALELINGYGDRVARAAVNSPASVTLSGEPGLLEEIAQQLEARGVFWRFLKVPYAFHSAQMDPVRDELLAALEGIRPRPATLPLFSTVSGRLVAGRELGPEYWWRNVRQAVRFADGVDCLIDHGADTLVELGPHPVLAAAVTECFEHRGKRVTVLPSLRRQEDERTTMLLTLGKLHALGHAVDWNGVLPEPQRFVRLPLYPWQRERFWHEAEESRVSRLTVPAHPLLGVLEAGPAPAWEARLDLRLTPYLADHRVQQRVIVPATAYLEIALAVGREIFGAGGCELRDVKLANPCFLTAEEPRRAHTTFDAETATVQVHTRPAQGDHDWTRHVTAVLQARPVEFETSASGDGAGFALDSVRNRCGREFDHASCYEALRRMGLDYGPMFMGIERVWQGKGEALGSVRLPERLGPEEAAYRLHPALFDACLQVAVPADSDFGARDGCLYLPYTIDRVELLGRPSGRVWVHARMLEKTARRCVVEVDVYDEDGEPVVRVRGLHSRRVAGGRGGLVDELFYAYRWHCQPIAASEGVSAAEPGHWLILADRGGVGDGLAERLRSRGEACTLVHPGSSLAERERIVQSLAGPGAASIRGVVHLWNLDAPRSGELSPSALAAAQDAGLKSVVQLVQTWDRAGAGPSAPLFLVTRGAQSVGDRPELLEVAQSPAIGLGRVIAGEYPRLRCKLVDLDPRAEESGLTALWDEIQAADDEDEVAWRGSQRYVHRYLPAPGLPEVETVQRGARAPYRLALRQSGTLDGLALQTLRRRPPGPGEVEIEVDAAGLNFSDVMKALGLYPGLPEGPVSLGAECSGRVTAVGAGVTGLDVGTEVLAVAGFAMGSHVLARAELVVPKPSRLSFEEAAALPLAMLTAAYALETLGGLGAGECVLIHSGSGGVGLAAIQIARRAGAEVIATAGTPEKRAYLQRLGIKTVLDSRSLAFADEVRRRTGGRGVDVILNSLPGAAIARGLDALADHGRFLEIGKRDIYENTRLGLLPFRNNLSFFAIDLDRVIRQRPALLRSLLREIVRRLEVGELESLPHRVWPITESVDAFRFMQQGKHIGKVVLSLRDQTVAAVPSEDEPVAFRGDASYLISGGLSGFGLAVARWMAGRGAGHLVLLGRRGLDTPGAREAVAELEALGTRVMVAAGDVARAEDLERILAEVDRALPPLRGVVQAAMVLEDALLINLDEDRLDRVLAPKVSGTWNLHAQTIGRPLDFFVLFSSVASVLGHPGQGNYAAANAFLDAMAWHRRARGLPALSVNWGYLGEVGYLARRGEIGERLERQGIMPISVAEALAALEKAMQREHTEVGVVRLEWSRWRGMGVTGRISPRLAHLCRRAEAGQIHGPALPQGLTGRDAVHAAAPGERKALLETLLVQKVARVLATATERLDVDRPLLQLGLDSLMAVELRNWIEGELQVNLPVVELMRSPSLSCLAELLAERFQSRDGAGTGTVSSGTRAEPEPEPKSEPANPFARELPPLEAAPEALLEQLEDLSGEQVDALLSVLLQDRNDDAGR